IVELGPAGGDPDVVDEGYRVGQRELQPPATAPTAGPAEEAAAAAPTTAAEATEAAAAASLGRRGRRGGCAFRRRGRRDCALRTHRPVAPAEAKLRPELVDHGLRRPPRLERLGKIEADAKRVAPRAVEVDGPEIDPDQLPGSVANEALRESRLDRLG